jgi:hypothetical protein
MYYFLCGAKMAVVGPSFGLHCVGFASRSANRVPHFSIEQERGEPIFPLLYRADASTGMFASVLSARWAKRAHFWRNTVAN